METHNLRVAKAIGLIVPLWNWNSSCLATHLCNNVGLIVPLWNWNKKTGCKQFATRGFNRTFMELKYEGTSGATVQPWGLIVPLWNWNDRTRPYKTIQDHGLIVPLWNWNSLGNMKPKDQRSGLIVPLWNWNLCQPIGAHIAKMV